jgi:redox-sensitive bicupin YhaK (pirin superfamily)
MGFGALRVINDDIIDAHSGFENHPHRDMEIITIVMEGVVTHGDSMGNTYSVPAGDVQVMSAGTGVVHSEHNNENSPLKLFQIWILPRTKGMTPRYDQRSFENVKKNKIELLVSGDRNDDALYINQNAYVSRAVLDEEKTINYQLHDPNNGVYIFVVSGSVRINDTSLSLRDAIGIWDTKKIEVRTTAYSELLIFEVPM